MDFIQFDLNQFITRALEEDLREGDHTSLACIPEEAMGKAQLLVKEKGVLAGMEIAREIFRHIDPEMVFHELMKDGAAIQPGDIAFTIEGRSQDILKGERLALNCMQHMSAIATKTNEMTSLIEGTGAKILDTRKTTPGLRALEKWSVKIGGGHNHRFGLFDMIMIKDNHIDYAGGIPQALDRTEAYLKSKGLDLKIEIEARDMDEVNAILASGKADRIMLDNFSPATTREAVKLIDGRCETESSGGITETTIRDYAECGVDYISIGALTHTVKNLDLSLKAI